jgi:hypothetical protein
MEAFEGYADVFDDDAMAVLSAGVAVDLAAAHKMLNAMADCWSYKDARGRPREGGAREEVRDLTVQTGNTVDPEGLSVDLPERLAAMLARAGLTLDAPPLAWIVFVAAIATEGYAQGFIDAAEYRTLADPFLIGTDLPSLDDGMKASERSR